MLTYHNISHVLEDNPFNFTLVQYRIVLMRCWSGSTVEANLYHLHQLCCPLYYARESWIFGFVTFSTPRSPKMHLEDVATKLR